MHVTCMSLLCIACINLHIQLGSLDQVVFARYTLVVAMTRDTRNKKPHPTVSALTALLKKPKRTVTVLFHQCC